MAKRSRPISRPVERAPFNRGAYVHQSVLAARATDFLREHGEDLPLLGSPETGSRRGSNRSEITPAFTYRAVFGDVDPDGPTITLASGVTMLVEEYESLVAEPDIDSVSQHATTAHRDRRLMSAASMTRTRYVGPCVTRSAGAWETADRWTTTSTTGRWRTLKSGAMTWTECPIPCPATCKQDHRHTRHVHRETGTTYVTGTRPYGEDGLTRGTTTTTIIGRLWGPGTAECPREGTAREVSRPLSKRQGRRTARVSIGAWMDAATYQHDPEHATAAYAVTLAEVTAVDGHNAHVGDGVAMLPATYVTERETLAVDWARPAFVPARVKSDRAGAQPSPILALGRVGLLRRIAQDPASTALAGRILLAAEHAWTTNGQPVTAEQGLTLTVLPAPHGGPSLTITRGGQQVATGTYKSRVSVVRNAVASLLTA